MGERKPLIRVHKIPAMSDYWGRRLKRPLHSGLLQESVERYLAGAESPLLLSLRTLHRKDYLLKDLGTVTARLFQEGDYAYVFRVSVTSAGGGKAHLAMIVAKDGGGAGHLARKEHDNLHRLYPRCREIVVQPLEGGILRVPGPRAGGVYAYFTRWLNRYHELGVQHKNMNFYINELPFQYFDSRQSDRLKSRMLILLFSLYDPVRREAVQPPKVGAGDFVVTRSRPHKLKLIACRKILKGVSLDRCIALYLGYCGTWGERIFHFLPDKTGLLRQALIEGLVIHHGFKEEEVFAALKRYRDGLGPIKPRQKEWTPLPALNKLLSEA